MIISCTTKYATPYKVIPTPMLTTQYARLILPSIIHNQLGIAKMKKKASFFSKNPEPF